MNEIKPHIKESITAFVQGGLTERSLALFKTLGYNTKRQFRGRVRISLDKMKESETIEFKKSTAEVKGTAISIAAMLSREDAAKIQLEASAKFYFISIEHSK